MHLVKNMFVICLVTYMAGCGHLIKPKLSTNIASLRDGAYRVDAQHSTILFKIDHLGLAKFVGRFNAFEASLDFSPQDMSQARLSARVDMSSVDVNSKQLEDRLRGRGWFNIEQYPYASFETQSAELIDADSAVFKGMMTFLGVSAPLEVLVHFNGGGTNVLTAKYTIGFEASARFKRSAFGLDKFIPAIGEVVELEIHAEFQRQ